MTNYHIRVSVEEKSFRKSFLKPPGVIPPSGRVVGGTAVGRIVSRVNWGGLAEWASNLMGGERCYGLPISFTRLARTIEARSCSASLSSIDSIVAS